MKDALFLFPEEIAKLLKISKGTVYELLRRGDIPSYRVGKQIRVSQADLQLYMHASDLPTKPPNTKIQVSLEK